MPNTCFLCNNLKRKARDFSVSFDFIPAELDSSVKAACPICTFLRDGIRPFEPKFGGMEFVRRVYVRGETLDGSRKGEIEMDLCLKNDDKVTLQFFAGPGK
jgi:hypothetical protein